MRIREIAQARVRYGYGKILALLRREGRGAGKYLVYRLYREEGLTLRQRRRGRRRVVVHRREGQKPMAPHQVWGLDFVADQWADGRRFGALTVVEVFTREGLAIEVGQSWKGQDVVKALNRIPLQRRAPKVLFGDNGSESWSQAMDLWGYQKGVRIDFSRPGKPTDNAYVESFHSTFRQEGLKAHWFMTPSEAREIIEAWRREYNESRPPRALGERTPNEFAHEIAAIETCISKGLR
jgi:putative transposase